MNASDQILVRADHLLMRLEQLLRPTPPAAPDWTFAAHRWRTAPGGGYLAPIRRSAAARLDDLLSIEQQKADLERNTRQFLQGLPANNALLWGPRGTGKSSLVKALLHAYTAQGLRLIELPRDGLGEMSEVVDLIATRPERFILYCDDLSFDEGDTGYRALKVTLDGSIAELPENVLIYATSNRRHLVPERLRDNEDTRVGDGEIHYGETVDERISLAERFGLRLAFHAMRQDEYLAIVWHWLRRLGVDPAGDAGQVREEALQWALAHGARSGRSAHQFARDWAGRRLLEHMS